MEERPNRAELEMSISALEKQRKHLGDALIDSAIAELTRQLDFENQRSLSTQGERKLITIMFADMSGFTAMSENSDPEYIRNLINECFEVLVPAAEMHGATIDKFIGDAVMALFGAPIAREDHAVRALNAALEMLERLSQFNKQKSVEIGIHFGINTGEVIAGEIGSFGRRDYSVIGDAVNVAARLQDMSKSGEIFVGPETHRLTRDYFAFEMNGSIPLKGRGAPVAVYKLTGRKPRLETISSPRAYETPMVGRDHEKRILREAVKELSETGRGAAILIAADAGVGKSRLLGEARQEFIENVIWVQGRAQSYAQTASYATERDIILELIGATIDTNPSSLIMKLRDYCSLYLDRLSEETYAHLALILGISPDETVLRFTQSVAPDALRPRISRAFLRFVKALAKERPLAVCFEDIHWVDAVSIQLVRDLIRDAPGEGVLLLLTARSEALPDLALDDGSVDLTEIRLLPLGERCSAELIQNFVGSQPISESAIQFLHNRSEGNPFFLEELMRSLAEIGAISDRNGDLILNPDISNAAIPTTLQGIILARLDRLPIRAKSTLQTASVIGRSFLLRLLAYAHDGAGIAAEKLSGRLRLLEDREFIRKNGSHEISSSDREYLFQHAITQEVVYGSLLESTRAEIHRKIAEIIEGYFGDRKDEFAMALAVHFDRAGNYRKAARFYMSAARRALATFAHEEASNCFGKALGQLEKSPGPPCREDLAIMAEAHIGQADILRQRGHHEAARLEYETALTLIDERSPILLASVHRKYGMSFTSQRMSKEALERSNLAYAALENSVGERSDAWWEERIEIQIERIWAAYWFGNSKLLREITDAAAPEIESHATPSQASRYYNGVVLISFRDENLNISEGTLSCAKTATELAERTRDPADLTRAYFLIACCHMWRGDLQDAEIKFQNVLIQLDHTGDTEWRVMTENYLALICRKRGDVEKTRYWTNQTLIGAERAQMPLYTALARAHESWIALREKRFDAAHSASIETTAMLRVLPFQVQWIAAWPLLACELARADRTRLKDVIGIMLQSNQQRQEVEVHAGLLKAMSDLESDRVESALKVLKEVLPLARSAGYC